MGRFARWLLVATALPISAWAQPLEPTPAPPPDDSLVPPGGDTAPVAQPTPPPTPPPPPPPAHSAAPRGFEEAAPPPEPGEEQESAASRPEGLSIGIGAGYDLPTDLQAPDTASVRLRLASGLTFEPFVTFAVSGTSTDFGDGDSGDDSASEVGLGTNVRIPVIGRGPVDLAMLAGARFDMLSEDPDGDDNDTSSTGVSLVWGLAVEMWFSAHCALSLNATNPLVAYTSTTEQTFDGESIDASSWSAGLVFRPDISFLLHVYL